MPLSIDDGTTLNLQEDSSDNMSIGNDNVEIDSPSLVLDDEMPLSIDDDTTLNLQEDSSNNTSIGNDNVEIDSAFILDDNKQEISKIISSGKILIAKKFILERRVLIKVLENIGYSYKAIEDTDILETEILTGKYDIVFTDKSLVTDTFREKYNHLNVITDKKSKEEIIEIVQRQRG